MLGLGTLLSMIGNLFGISGQSYSTVGTLPQLSSSSLPTIVIECVYLTQNYQSTSTTASDSLINQLQLLSPSNKSPQYVQALGQVYLKLTQYDDNMNIQSYTALYSCVIDYLNRFGATLPANLYSKLNQLGILQATKTQYLKQDAGTLFG